MFAFAMAAVSRCAVSTLCPTDGELKAALYARIDDGDRWLCRRRAAQKPEHVCSRPPNTNPQHPQRALRKRNTERAPSDQLQLHYGGGELGYLRDGEASSAR